MENRERYKRLIMFLASAVIIAIETLLFAYIWYKFYAHKEVIGRRFDRGNQVVIGLYVLMIYFFYKIYGGFKVGSSSILPEYLSLPKGNTVRKDSHMLLKD